MKKLKFDHKSDNFTSAIGLPQKRAKELGEALDKEFGKFITGEYESTAKSFLLEKCLAFAKTYVEAVYIVFVTSQFLTRTSTSFLEEALALADFIQEKQKESYPQEVKPLNS